MFRSSFICAVLFVAISTPCKAQLPTINFQRDIRPLLSDRCFHCHGPDEKTRQADLRLDQWESAKSVIDSTLVDQSKLLQRIESHDASEIMPPPEVNKPLSQPERELLRQWIVQGAKWQQHWAYEQPQRTAPPTLSSDDRSANWIDAFILLGLRSQGLEPTVEADSTILLRRVCFDLTGLPPSDELVLRWNSRQVTYAQIVDQLLASPEFGERMAMYWLDLVRYADTVGYHGDQDHNISAYRDWVINAFIDGKPFDVMTVEQLSGDLLPSPTTEQRIATGYNRLLQTTHEGGLQPKEYRAIYAADRVRNVSAVWLAGTLGCAQCHDHKFDPFTMKDFYSLAAFFADVDDESHFKTGSNDLPTRRDPELELPTPEQNEQILKCQAEGQELKSRVQKLEKQPTAEQSDELKAEIASAQAALKKSQVKLAELKKSVRRTMITVALKEPRETRILPRGNWLDESGQLVDPRFPQFMILPQPTTSNSLPMQLPTPLSASDKGQRLTRLDLARWLVDDQKGVGLMTARVMVNRLWYLMFGSGIARSLDEFGSQGEAPTHPELFDNLAHHLVDNHWDLRATMRLIANSRTYRQASIADTDLQSKDPRNQWYARQNALRLPAESIRDNALAVSGLLVKSIGGESVRPYQPAGYYKLLNFPERDYSADKGARQWRRGLYMHWQRQFLHPMLKSFDATSREECTAARPRSNTPLSALTLLNDPTFVEAARVLAERLLISPNNTSQSDHERIDQLFLWVIQRQASADEADVLLELLNSNRQEYQSRPEAIQALLSIGIRPANTQINAKDLASWTQVCRAILNMSETTTRY